MAQALDIIKLIEKLASIEEEGVAFYESLAQHAENEDVKKLAQTMARVEKRHQRRFESLAQTLGKRKEKKPVDKVTASVRQYILTLVDHRIFHSPEHAKKLAKSLTNAKEAVDIAIQFEKDNILLLLECGAIAGGEARKLIETFLAQEKAHIRSLSKILIKLTKAT
jgi:rubrerythrin